MTPTLRLAHLHDLRFGQENPQVVLGLLRRLRELAPDVIAISGDFTARAERRQFALAQSFIRALPAPVIAVPGERDIPAFNPLSRIFRPLERFHRAIEKDPCPVFHNPRGTVVGLNTARSRAWKSGRLDLDQSEDLRKRLEPRRSSPLKVLITSQPFMASSRLRLFGYATQALDTLEDLGVDLVLTGCGPSMLRSRRRPRSSVQGSVLIAQTGSAAALRPEGRGNGFNLLNLAPERISISVQRWQNGQFRTEREIRFDRHLGAWQREEAEARFHLGEEHPVPE